MEYIENEQEISEQEEQLPLVLKKRFAELDTMKQHVLKLEKDNHQNLELAKEVNSDKPTFFDKWKTIKGLQDVVVSLSHNQVENTKITQEIISYQQKTYETMKYLFTLGLSNLAKNRAIVKYLKSLLKKEGESEFDEFEQKEIMQLLTQLKAQEDILIQVEDVKAKLKQQQVILDQQEKRLAILEEKYQVVDELKEEVLTKTKEDQDIKKKNKLFLFTLIFGSVLSLAALIISIIAIIL